MCTLDKALAVAKMNLEIIEKIRRARGKVVDSKTIEKSKPIEAFEKKSMKGSVMRESSMADAVIDEPMRRALRLEKVLDLVWMPVIHIKTFDDAIAANAKLMGLVNAVATDNDEVLRKILEAFELVQVFLGEIDEQMLTSHVPIDGRPLRRMGKAWNDLMESASKFVDEVPGENVKVDVTLKFPSAKRKRSSRGIHDDVNLIKGG